MAASGFLTVGGYAFHGFGLPEVINGGGAHQLIVNKLPGGARVIDAMGADDDVIAFRGRFRNSDGIDAMTDAMLMDAMRRAGKPVSMAYWNQTATVIVSKFKFEFRRFMEVPYELELTVVQSGADAAGTLAATIDAAIGSDLALALKTVAGGAAVAAMFLPVATAFTTAGPLKTATPANVAAANSAMSTTYASASATAQAADILLGTPGGTTAGGDPSAMASALTAQAGILGDGAAAQNTLPVIQRMQINANTLNGVLVP